MKIIPAILAVCALTSINACTASPRAITHDELPTLYYKTNKEQSKAYVFYSKHDLLIVGMPTLSTSDAKAQRVAISFGGVKDSPENRAKYDASDIVHFMSGDLCVTEIPIESIPNLEQEFQLYYTTKDGPWKWQIPYRGRIGKNELQNKAREDKREVRRP